MEICFWPYFSAEIALLKVNSLHFVKRNGCFIHPNSHSIDAMFQQTVLGSARLPPVYLSLLGHLFYFCVSAWPQHLEVILAMVTVHWKVLGQWWDSTCPFLPWAAWSYVGVTWISTWVKENKQGLARLGTNLGWERSAWDLGRKDRLQNKL